MESFTLELFGETYTWQDVEEVTAMDCVNPEGYAEIYGLNVEYVRRLCRANRIPGAMREADGWVIPVDAVRRTRGVSDRLGGQSG